MLANSALIDGNVLTMNSFQPSAEAIAIKKDRIVKVGTNEEISPWIGKNTKVISLKERTVVLGFIDTRGRCGIWKVLSVDRSKRR